MNLYMGNSNPNIIIIGDIMLDHNIEGIATKIANEGPIPVINVLNERYSIGGCGNVILNSLALGAKNIFILSRVGADDNGIKLQNILPHNCQNYILNDPDYITITKTRVYSDKKLVARYDKEITCPITNEQEINIIDNFKKVISENKISSVIFSDYNKGFLTKSLCQTIIKLCNENNIISVVDPKVDYTKYIGCTVIKPNKAETNNIFKIDLDKVSYENAHKSLQNILQCKMSVITLAGDGISGYYDNTHFKIKEDTKDVIDVTGAGDVVCAVLGTYYKHIDDKEMLLKIANHLASISVGHLGVYTVTNTDLINTYRYINNNTNNIGNISKLIDLEAIIQLNLNKTVFTNGCFDILHSAHIELFKFCKTLGDIVIVGLNSDESIKRLKGPLRPINSINERVKMLEALHYIDFIIIFNDDTPLSIIQEIKPDYLVKGGDYAIESIIGREYAKNTVIFKYIDGKSTTNIIKRINDTN